LSSNAEKSVPSTGTTVHLHYQPPYDWPAMISYLRARAIAGVEKVENGQYTRTFLHDGKTGSLTVAHAHETSSLAVTIRAPGVDVPSPLTARLRKMFDLTADVALIGATLTQDPLLKRLFTARPGLRVGGAWDPFELAVRAVLGQQVTLQAGRRLTQTLVRLCGVQIPPAERGGSALEWIFPRAQQVATADLAPLRMPAARKRALVEVAKAACADARLFEPGANLEQTIARLTAITGIGEWTAHYIAMRAIREPDAFPATDAALVRCMAHHEGARPGKLEFVERAQRWRPWRAYAAQHLWSAGVTSKPNEDIEE